MDIFVSVQDQYDWIVLLKLLNMISTQKMLALAPYQKNIEVKYFRV